MALRALFDSARLPDLWRRGGGLLARGGGTGFARHGDVRIGERSSKCLGARRSSLGSNGDEHKRAREKEQELHKLLQGLILKGKGNISQPLV